MVDEFPEAYSKERVLHQHAKTSSPYLKAVVDGTNILHSAGGNTAGEKHSDSCHQAYECDKNHASLECHSSVARSVPEPRKASNEEPQPGRPGVRQVDCQQTQESTAEPSNLAQSLALTRQSEQR